MHVVGQLDHLGTAGTVHDCMHCFVWNTTYDYVSCICTVHAVFSIHIYMCTLSMSYTRTKAYFVKIKIRILQNLVSFNIVMCTFLPGHSIQGRKQEGSIPLYARIYIVKAACAELHNHPMPKVRWATWPWLPRFRTVCCFFVSIYQASLCISTVHSVFSYGQLYVIFQSLSHKNKGLVGK